MSLFNTNAEEIDAASDVMFDAMLAFLGAVQRHHLAVTGTDMSLAEAAECATDLLADVANDN